MWQGFPVIRGNYLPILQKTYKHPRGEMLEESCAGAKVSQCLEAQAQWNKRLERGIY